MLNSGKEKRKHLFDIDLLEKSFVVASSYKSSVSALENNNEIIINNK